MSLCLQICQNKKPNPYNSQQLARYLFVADGFGMPSRFICAWGWGCLSRLEARFAHFRPFRAALLPSVRCYASCMSSSRYKNAVYAWPCHCLATDVRLYWSMQGETQKDVVLQQLHTWRAAILQVRLMLVWDKNWISVFDGDISGCMQVYCPWLG